MALNADTGWRIQPALTAATSWRIEPALTAAASWRIEPALEAKTAWLVKAELSAETGWRIGWELSADTGWRIQPPLTAEVAWKIAAGGLSAPVAWQVRARIAPADVAWKISAAAGVIPGQSTHTLSVSAGASAIDPLSLTLSADRESLGWRADLELKSAADYALCTVGKSLTLELDGVSWALEIDDRDQDRHFPASAWRISAVAAWTRTADETVSLTLSAPALASEAAAALAGDDLSWEACNWILPEGLKLAENRPRREALAELAAACGARLLVDRAGSLKVRPGWPRSGAAPAAEWGDGSVLSASSKTAPRTARDRVLVGSSGLRRPRSLSLEVAERDDLDRCCRIKAVVSPEPVAPELSTCGPAGEVSLGAGYAAEETVTRPVSFVDGFAAIPEAAELVSVDWDGHTDLGAVELVAPGTLLAATAASSLANVTYKVSWWEFLLTVSDNELSTQVCGRVDDLESDIIVDCRRGAYADLAPEILTSPCCTDAAAAAERGRVYLEEQGGDLVTRELELLWQALAPPEPGELVRREGSDCRLAAYALDYQEGRVSCRATLEEVV
jgi:hypothetical protein